VVKDSPPTVISLLLRYTPPSVVLRISPPRPDHGLARFEHLFLMNMSSFPRGSADSLGGLKSIKNGLLCFGPIALKNFPVFLHPVVEHRDPTQLPTFWF